MIKIENVEMTGWEAAIRGMRNPKNSWQLSDSDYGCEIVPGSNVKCYECSVPQVKGCNEEPEYIIGPNDHKLMMSLSKGGPVHAKYRRMITVYLDLTAPLYWWKEFDTYKVGTVANSCSTMHKIHAKEFTLEDFSHEHLGEDSLSVLQFTIDHLNKCRTAYLESKDEDHWRQMIQLLPSSYNQKRTVMLNYEVLHNMYASRKNHKLDEWVEFCKWIETLPYSEIITTSVKQEKETLGWKPVSEYDQKVQPWVLVRYCDEDTETEFIPRMARMTKKGTWVDRVGDEFPKPFKVLYFFDITQLKKED